VSEARFIRPHTPQPTTPMRQLSTKKTHRATHTHTHTRKTTVPGGQCARHLRRGQSGARSGGSTRAGRTPHLHGGSAHAEHHAQVRSLRSFAVLFRSFLIFLLLFCPSLRSVAVFFYIVYLSFFRSFLSLCFFRSCFFFDFFISSFSHSCLCLCFFFFFLVVAGRPFLSLFFAVAGRLTVGGRSLSVRLR
jgi:hypothetical protein